MKQFKHFFLLTVLMSMVGVKAMAYDIAVENTDGITIYYNYISEGLELEVVSDPNSYKGNVIIPDEVTYMNRTRKVTSIGSSAFFGCSGLTSVTIPNSVTSIGKEAFYDCSGLTSVTIPNSVPSIGKNAFYRCSDLKKVIVKDIAAWCKIDFVVRNNLGFDTNITNPLFYAHHLFSDENTEITDLVIPNSVTSISENAFYNCSGLTSVTIGNSVTSIGNEAFNGCRGLTSVTIPNSVTSIGNEAFNGCRGLTSVTIPNSVTSIGDRAFEDCSGLTSVIIPNSVTSTGDRAFQGCSGLTSVTISNSVKRIGEGAFLGCSGLTSVTIPNSVTSISENAFYNCSGLTSVTIGNSVTSIGAGAFYCDNLATVVSLIEKPFVINGKSSNDPVFNLNTFMNGTLYVPIGTKDAYKATDGWKEFLFIEEGNGGSEPVTPETKKCEKPSISYQNGKLTFSSETEGATCVSSITDGDMGTYTTNEVQLGVTYNISVYATKTGYENSETVTATLCWIDQQPKTQGITDGIANVPANAVMIQSEAGMLSVQGADDGTQVSAYAINGTQVGSVISQNGHAVINTNLKAGSIAIVKIGNRSVKVVMK